MKLAPNLHRIGNDIVAAYLVEGEGGLTLVDAGVSGQWSDLQSELRDMGRANRDIKGVILTHGDTDHVGFAERLRRDHGVPVFVHEADAPRARGEVRKPNASGGPMKIGPLLRFLWYAGRKGGLRTSPAAPRWICRVARASFTFRATRRGASRSTCRRSTRSSSATR